jgi:hypothetical protein
VLSQKQIKELLELLQARFGKNKHLHPGLEWTNIQARLEANGKKLQALAEMERTGGEPDIVGHDEQTDEYIFYDCAPESPKGRRSLCYDREALDGRKENKPANSALDMARALGIELLTEAEYRDFQNRGPFDQKTSSWLKTPADIRKRGGAIFGDYRYGTVFIYHNGADSYYAARGFRGMLKV